MTKTKIIEIDVSRKNYKPGDLVKAEGDSSKYIKLIKFKGWGFDPETNSAVEQWEVGENSSDLKTIFLPCKWVKVNLEKAQKLYSTYTIGRDSLFRMEWSELPESEKNGWIYLSTHLPKD